MRCKYTTKIAYTQILSDFLAEITTFFGSMQIYSAFYSFFIISLLLIDMELINIVRFQIIQIPVIYQCG